MVRLKNKLIQFLKKLLIALEFSGKKSIFPVIHSKNEINNNPQDGKKYDQ
jgi:hypothetical protein